MARVWTEEEEKMLVDEYNKYFYKQGNAWGFYKYFSCLSGKSLKQIENKLNRMRTKGEVKIPFRWVSK